tara:strand:+ start:11280 stop:12401 length:1122 start_codon:yes stop_codon:yes gene_type:complete
MNLLPMVARNFKARRMRTALTLFGIAVGMMAIVALMGLSRGFERGWDQTMNARGTDAVINRAAAGSPIPAPFSEDIAASIRSLPGIESSGGVLSSLVPVGNLPMVLITSWEWSSYIWNHLTIVEGRMPQQPDEQVILLGKSASQALGKGVGETLLLYGTKFPVCGIYESASMIESGAILIPLEVMQRKSDNVGKINFLNLRFDPGTESSKARSICREIENIHPGLSASLASESAQQNSTTKAVRGMTLAVTLLSMIVGLTSVMNTMLMSVFERTMEIGVLRAIGWKASRIRRMILLEASLLGVAGGLLGVLLAFAVREILYLFPSIGSTIRIEIALDAVLFTVVFATIVGAISGLYPAIRASRMKPTVAFRHQ